MEALLMAYRKGDDDARQAIHDRLIHLVYERKVRGTRQITANEMTGPLYIAFATALDRLKTNSVPPQKVKAYVNRCLSFTFAEYVREISGNLLPPRSTKHTRQKRGRDAAKLRRLNWSDQYGLYHGSEELIDFHADMETVFPDEEERDMATLLHSGSSQRQVATALGMSRRRVRAFVEQLRRKFAENADQLRENGTLYL